MRAQLRTYHSIPSLQARQDPNAYKQLQDAPRLKSILKGATEDTEQPSSLEEIKKSSVPRTNPVNLIFVLAQYAPKISEVHFDVPRDFFDLVMKPGLSSRSRSTGFLWLMWWYLESDFSDEDALNNPFGQGRSPKAGEPPLKLPHFEPLTDAQAALENVDTEEEKDFGELKRQERVAILQTDMAPVVTGPKRGVKKSFNNNPVFSVAESEAGIMTPSREYNSPAPSQGIPSALSKPPLIASSVQDDGYDTDRTRSASPPVPPPTTRPAGNGMRINTLLNEDTPPALAVPVPPPAPVPATATLPTPVTAPSPAPAPAPTPAKGPGRGNWRRPRDANAVTNAARAASKATQEAASSPAQAQPPSGPHGFYLPLNGSDPAHKRTRPLTAHQVAVERYRKERIDFILDRRLRHQHRQAKRERQKEGLLGRAWKRCKFLPDSYDSEEELLNVLHRNDKYGEHGYGPGFVGLARVNWEIPNDYGEEHSAMGKTLRRVSRRLERWEGDGVLGVRKKKERWVDDEVDDYREERIMDRSSADPDATMEYEAGDEELDEEDRELLGEVDADEVDDEDEMQDEIMVGAG